MSDGWFRTFFDAAANDHWNAALPASYTADQADFLVAQLGLAPGATVLDLPAGRGRLALPLAERGMRVTAVDISADGTRRLGAAVDGRAVSVVRADMRAVPLRGPFDAVYCMGNSFGYFPVDGVESFLAEVDRLLAPGGRFVLESATVAESMAVDFAPVTEHDFGGVHVLGHHRLDPDAERVVTDLTITDGDGVRTAVIDQLVLASARIAELVTAAGLTVDALLGDLDSRDYDETARSLLIVAHRPA